MGYQERQGLIRQIETLRESRVITLVTGDRNIAQTQIADDCLKPLYDLLVGIRDNGCPNRIDLFLETEEVLLRLHGNLLIKSVNFATDLQSLFLGKPIVQAQ